MKGGSTDLYAAETSESDKREITKSGLIWGSHVHAGLDEWNGAAVGSATMSISTTWQVAYLVQTHPEIVAALDVAYDAHGDQKRKYTNDTYIVHPIEVAYLVALTYPDKDYMQAVIMAVASGEQPPAGKNDMLQAAILHDVVEDTRVTLDQVRQHVGDKVAALVAELTNPSKPTDGNRAVRKAIDADHIAKASAAAQTIKCADIMSNVQSIAQHDPEFARVYLREKAELLPRRTKALPDLHTSATLLVNHWLEKVNP